MTFLVFSETDAIDDKGYVTCDCCHESGVYDVWDQKPVRDMYWLEPDGLYVCQNCFGEVEL